MRALHVALLYNLKENAPREEGAPEDALAELDSVETVRALEAALRAGGHKVTPLEGNLDLYPTLYRMRDEIDLAFNICEGHRGESRESQVPAILEMLGIPYTASKVLANALSLDKPMAKRVLTACGVPTPPFQIFTHGTEEIDPALSFPLFVKPSREGTGMGISSRSIVEDEESLREQVAWVIRTYRQPALVETYLPGRELTVGLLGNALPAGAKPLSELYEANGFHIFPILEIDLTPVPESQRGLYTSYVKSEMPLAPNYICPAHLEPALERELKRLAVAAFNALGCLDVSRVDFRLDAEGRPYVLEINTLPGLNPEISDLCIMARAEGMAYHILINEIVNQAAMRYGLDVDQPHAAYGKEEIYCEADRA
ncbi:MAG: D-alanine--D-alanine ligase family protein [Candidatus Zipacnadales bacterium]